MYIASDLHLYFISFYMHVYICMYVYMYVYIYICMYVFMCVYVCMCVCVCVCMYMCNYMCAYIYLYPPILPPLPISHRHTSFHSFLDFITFRVLVQYHTSLGHNTVPSYHWLLITHKIIGGRTSLTLVAFIIYTWLWDIHKNPLGYAPNQWRNYHRGRWGSCPGAHGN